MMNNRELTLNVFALNPALFGLLLAVFEIVMGLLILSKQKYVKSCKWARDLQEISKYATISLDRDVVNSAKKMRVKVV